MDGERTVDRVREAAKKLADSLLKRVKDSLPGADADDIREAWMSILTDGYVQLSRIEKRLRSRRLQREKYPLDPKARQGWVDMTRLAFIARTNLYALEEVGEKLGKFE